MSTDAERSLLARELAHRSWGATPDRTARTEPARRALDAKFLAEADGDEVRAEHLRKAHYLRLARLSALSRRKAKGLTATAVAAEAELDNLGGDIDGRSTAA
jgi:hypothetical protein